ncbi:MAG: hypothetical protein EXS08_02890 [Planctomycetes bacterium]|nr:hypothetical protein [Planctomycetota bacterium]
MSVRRRVLVPLACVLGVLLAAELGLRVFAARFLWRPLPPFGEASEQREWLERSERELAAGTPPLGYSRFDSVLGWSTAPGYVSPDGRVHINAQGLRGTREYEAVPPPGVERVIVCGESFTFAEEVADGEAWPAQLEALVPSLEVLNYGVGGYGTDQALLRVSREAHGPADALIVGLMLENIGRNVNRYRPLWYPRSQPAAKPRYVLGADGLEFVAQPFATREEFVGAVRAGTVRARLAEHERWADAYVPARLRWSLLARLAGAQRAYAERDPERLWRDIEGEPFRTTLALLEAFRGVAQGLRAEQLVVLVFPSGGDLAGFVERDERYWSSLLDALAARHLAVLDLTPPLAVAAREAGGVDALYLDSHLSPRGNQIVAQALAAWLAQGRKPPGSK